MASRRGIRKRPPADARVAASRPERTLGPLPRFVLAAAAPIVLLSTRLTNDLWGDEVYTLAQFVTRDWSRLFAPPWEPNHHLLYTALLKVTVEVADTVVVWRLPGLILAVLTLATIYRLGLRFGPAGTGELAVLALGTNQMYLDHALQLRGYGLSAWLTTLLFSWSFSPAISRGKNVAIGLAVASLVLTLPTNVVFVGALAMVRARRLVQSGIALRALAEEAASWAVGLLAPGLVYLPLVDDLRRAAQVSQPLGYGWLIPWAGNVLWAGERDFLPLWILAAAGGLWTLARRVPTSEPSAASGPSLARSGLGIVLVSFGLTLGLGRPPFVRNFVPLVPILAVVLAVGWMHFVAQLANRCSGRWPRLARPETITAAAGIALLAFVAPWLATYPARLDAVRRERFAQDGYYNYYSARYEPARLVDMLLARLPDSSPYLVACDAADYHVVHFYLGRAGTPAARVLDPRAETAPVALYWIAPPRPHFGEAAARYGFSPATLAGLPRVAEAGYYALHASAEPIVVRLAPAAAGGANGASNPGDGK